jgi:histidine triad (HIT) family protein
MESCIFCKIISYQASAYVIAETDSVIVFVSLHGDPLVVPKKHVRDIYGLDAATGADVMAELIRTANAVKRGLQCDGVYITQANDPAAGQDVFHLHFHVYPRWSGQTPTLVRAADAERQRTMERVRTAYAVNN